MQQPETPQKVSELIARYREELLELHAKKTAEAPPPSAKVETDWLDVHFPSPDISRDKAALASAAEEVNDPTYPYNDDDLNGQVPREEQPPSPPAASPAYTGYLRVFVFTGNTAEPLAGARVTVTRAAEGTGDVLFASATTDIDGFTSVIPLPSVSPALTMQPGVSRPYVAYNIRVTADGFSPTEFENVPVYGDNYVTQPAAMVPLLEGQDPNSIRRFPSQGPADL